MRKWKFGALLGAVMCVIVLTTATPASANEYRAPNTAHVTGFFQHGLACSVNFVHGNYGNTGYAKFNEISGSNCLDELTWIEPVLWNGTNYFRGPRCYLDGYGCTLTNVSGSPGPGLMMQSHMDNTGLLGTVLHLCTVLSCHEYTYDAI